MSGAIVAESERRDRKQKAREEGSDDGSSYDGRMGGSSSSEDGGVGSMEAFHRAQKVQRRMRMSRFPVPGESTVRMMRWTSKYG